MKLGKYKTFIFDCDGVLLDSNNIKSKAFYEVVLPYGVEYAETFVKYHQMNGGISRFKKFEYFFKEIINKSEYENDLNAAIEAYSIFVKKELLACPEIKGMRSFISQLPKEVRKIVVSGGAQSELREVFMQRQLNKYFNEIFGSPDTKVEILKRESIQGALKLPAVYFGDSKYDYEVAREFNLDFVFISQYTEFETWREFFQAKDVTIVSNFEDMLAI